MVLGTNMAEGTVLARLVGAHTDDVPLSDLATALGVVDYTDYLGKREPTGLFGAATLFDPSAAAWDDVGSGGTGLGWNTHHGGREVDQYQFAVSDAFAAGKLYARRFTNSSSIASGAAGQVGDQYRVEASNGNYSSVDLTAQADPNGTGRFSALSLYNDLNDDDGVVLDLTDTRARLLMRAMPSQTDALIDLLDEDGTSAARFTQDGLGSILPLLGQVSDESNPWSGVTGDAFFLSGYTPGFATAPSVTFGTTGENSGTAGFMLQPAGADGGNAAIIAAVPWGSDPTKTKAYFTMYAEQGFAQFQAGGFAGNGGLDDGVSFDLEGGGSPFFRVQKSIAGVTKFGIFDKASAPAVQPTGVAVTAAAIHAALITLGWFTA